MSEILLINLNQTIDPNKQIALYYRWGANTQDATQVLLDFEKNINTLIQESDFIKKSPNERLNEIIERLITQKLLDNIKLDTESYKIFDSYYKTNKTIKEINQSIKEDPWAQGLIVLNENINIIHENAQMISNLTHDPDLEVMNQHINLNPILENKKPKPVSYIKPLEFHIEYNLSDFNLEKNKTMQNIQTDHPEIDLEDLFYELFDYDFDETTDLHVTIEDIIKKIPDIKIEKTKQNISNQTDYVAEHYYIQDENTLYKSE